jgi:hypothetical protein
MKTTKQKTKNQPSAAIKKFLNKTHETYFIGFDDKKIFHYIGEYNNLEEAQDGIETMFSSEKFYIIKRVTSYEFFKD